MQLTVTALGKAADTAIITGGAVIAERSEKSRRAEWFVRKSRMWSIAMMYMLTFSLIVSGARFLCFIQEMIFIRRSHYVRVPE